MRLLQSFCIFVLLFSLPTRLAAQWQRLPDPPGAMALAFSEIPKGSGYIYAATLNGLWLSTDHMVTWNAAGLQGHIIYGITGFQDSLKRLILILTRDSGIYRSFDSGHSWMKIYAGGGILSSDNVLIIWTQNNISITSDFGDTWKSLGSPPSNQFLTMGVSNGILYAIVETTGVWTMPITGGQWTLTPYPANHYGNSFFAKDSTIYIGGNGVIDISTDLGQTWRTPSNKGLDTTSGRQDIIYSFVVHGQTIISYGWRAMYRSTDLAQTWTRLDGTGSYPNYYALMGTGGYSVRVQYLDGHFVTGEPGGILKSADGISWQFAGSGITSPAITDIASVGNTIFTIIKTAVFHSTDHGKSWSEQGDLEHASRLIELNGMLFALTDEGRVWRWAQGEWSAFVSRVNDDITAIHDTLFGSSWGRVYISADSGATWKNTTPVPDQYLEPIYSFGDTLFTVVNVGNPGWPVYYSTDHGISWNKAGTMPTDGGFFYFRTGTTSDEVAIYNLNHINVSQDRGFHWKTIGSQFTTFIKNHNNVLLLGLEDSSMSRSGLFKLAGANLIQILPDTEVSTINGFAADDQFGYIATARRGIWRSSLSNLELSSVHSPEKAVSALEVYPNPTEGQETITISAGLSRNTQIKIYDELGILRRTISDNSEKTVDIHKLPSGIYTVVVTSANQKTIAHLIVNR